METSFTANNRRVLMSVEPIPTPAPSNDEGHRSFTVRVPKALYIEIASRAFNEGRFINKKVNELLLLGLGKSVNIDDMLMRMIKDRIPQEDAANG